MWFALALDITDTWALRFRRSIPASRSRPGVGREPNGEGPAPVDVPGCSAGLRLKVDGPTLPDRRSGIPLRSSGVRASLVPGAVGCWLTATVRGLAQA